MVITCSVFFIYIFVYTVEGKTFTSKWKKRKMYIGLLVVEKRTETRDGVSMLVHCVTEKEQSEYFKTNATNVQLGTLY